MKYATTSERHQLKMFKLKLKANKKRREARKAAIAAVAAQVPQLLQLCDADTAKALDKYYTRKEVAKFCVQVMKAVTPAGGFYVEPSAGAGAFLYTGLIDIKGFDLLPEDGRIIQADFLKTDLADHLKPHQMADLRIIGNPPFGLRQKLVLDFLNKSLAVSKYVGFIVGKSFDSHHYHRRVMAGAHLIVDIELPHHSFTHNGKPYRTALGNGLASRFQVWTTEPVDVAITGQWEVISPDTKPKLRIHDGAKDFRRYVPHVSKHEDFASVRRGGAEAPAFFTIAVPACMVKQKNVVEFACREELKDNFLYYFLTANDETVANVLKRMNYHDMVSGQVDKYKRLPMHRIITEYLKVRDAGNDNNPLPPKPTELAVPEVAVDIMELLRGIDWDRVALAYPSIGAAMEAARASAPLVVTPQEVAANENTPLRVVDLFSGIGGMSLGFQNAGYDVVAAFDAWDKAVDVYGANFNHPVHKFDLGDHARAAKRVTKYKPDAIVGGPPCQDYSAAGKQTLGARAALTISFAKIVAKVQPRYFVMENVQRAQKSATYQEARAIFRKAGYGLTEKVLDASLCGAPQKRKRLIVIGKLGAADGWLDVELKAGLAAEPMTIRQYLGDELGFDHYYNHPRFYDGKAVFSVGEPAPTIRGTNRVSVPPSMANAVGNTAPVSTVSGLSPEQRARIQTFPVTFKLGDGARTDKDKMVGNAVPPALARYVAEAIAANDGWKLAERGVEAA